MSADYKFEDVFTSSQGYADRFAGKIGQWLISLQNKAILKVLSGRSKKAQMLDVGGGHGQLIELAAELGLELHLSVSHEDALSNLSKRMHNLGKDNLSYEGIVSDLFSIPCKDKSFFVVSSVRLLSHCDDWKRLVSEFCRLSSDYVVVDYPPILSSNIFYKILFPIKKILEGNTRTFTIFRHSEIDNVFLENGFKIKERIGQFFWPMVLHRKLNSVPVSRTLENAAALLGLVRLFGNPTIALYERVK